MRTILSKINALFNRTSTAWTDFYETFSNHHLTLKLAALLIVGLLYLSTEIIPFTSWLYAEDVRGQALIAHYDTTQYVVEGLPNSVDVTLTGKESLVRTTIQKKQLNCYLDLTSLKPGYHIVDVKYDMIPSDLNVELNPKSVAVFIKERISQEFAITLDYLNEDLISSQYALGTPEMEVSTVSVEGAKDLVDKVIAVKGMIDVSNVNQLQQLKVPLFALDKEGNKVALTLQPQEVTVSIPFEVPQKVIPIKATLASELPEGMGVRRLTTNPTSVTLLGDESILASISQILIEVNPSQFNEAGIFVSPLLLPDGLTAGETETVQVSLELSSLETITFKNIAVQTINLPAQYRLSSSSTLETQISITGLKETLDQLTEKQFSLHLDLSQLSEGTHAVTPQLLEKIEGVTIEIDPLTVTLRKSN